jgi:ArsR family transcriptional regulator
MSLHSAADRARTIERDAARAEHVADVLKAVAHPLRVRIVALLCRRDRHVNELAEALGVVQPIVSQQLRILRSNGLVAVRRQDGFAWYRISEPALRDLVCCMERCGRG